MLHKQKVYIKENTWFAKIAAKKMSANQLAIVFNNTIHLHNTPKKEFLEDTRWLCHELIHIKQYQREGIFKFLVKYVWQWMQVGYYNISFEKEARENENNVSLISEFDILID
jgi:hypothetical protein